jgi:hypothetical protein
MDMFNDLFGENIHELKEVALQSKYTNKVETPIYEPKNKKPHILELVDVEKTKRLIREISKSNLDDFEKRFLIEAAHRHSVFNYSKIADYYAHASAEMQDLMEKSALVIIDYDKSIEYGFTHLQEEIKKEWVKNKQIQALNNEK